MQGIKGNKGSLHAFTALHLLKKNPQSLLLKFSQFNDQRGKRRHKMHCLKKIYFLQFLLLLLNIFFLKSISQETPERYINSIRNIHSCSDQNSSLCYDNPIHVPNPCDECKDPDGHCGSGLRCICHPKECKDKVISAGAVLKPCCYIIFSPLIFLLLKEYLQVS